MGKSTKHIKKTITLALSSSVKKDLLWSVAVVCVWRLVMQIYAVFVLHRFPLTNTINQASYWLTIWYNYDGHHYVGIARQGYSLVQYAFFPLFPLAIHILAWPAVALFGNKLTIYIVAGLIISTLSLMAAVFFMLRLARRHFDIDAGKRAVFLLLFFPSAIFLAAVYTESFFLLWVTGSFFFAGRRNWAIASLFAAAAAVTRLVGIGLFACLAIEFYLTYRHAWKDHIRQALWLLLIPASFTLYLLYQWLTVGNPLQFLASQQAWGRTIGWHSFQFLLHDLTKGLDIFHFGAAKIAPMYDAVATVIGIGMAIVLAVKKMWSYALFALMATAISLTSGTTVGLVRYIIVIFPMFLLWGYWTRKAGLYAFMLASFAIIFALLSIHYLNTWWLA